MRIILFAIFTFFLMPSVAQKNSFSPAEMHKDLDYLNKYLRKWHPTYYDYTPKADMDVHLKNLKSYCDTSFSTLKFGSLIRQTVSKVGCGHMDVRLPQNGIKIDSALTLPIDVYILDEKIYVRKYFGKDSVLKNGDEILSIDGIATDSLLKSLSSIIVSDGNNETHKSYLLEKAFFIYYYRIFGGKTNSKIIFKPTNSFQKEVVLKYIYRASYENYQRNTNDSSKIIIKGSYINLQKTDISDKTFLIDFNSFSGPKLRKSYRQIFKYLYENKAKNLIIDLRDNGGGNVFGGFNFMKYLIKSPVQFVNLSRKPNLTIINPRFKAGFFERITPLLFMMNPLQYPSKNGWNHAFFFLKHFSNHYDKNLFVITNGQTFSMAAMTATLLKNKAKAIVVGEETGGSSYASRGMAQGKIVLPNSKIEVYLNVYQLKYGQHPDTGRGVMPDYSISYNFEERQEKIDKEMNKIKELILLKKSLSN